MITHATLRIPVSMEYQALKSLALRAGIQGFVQRSWFGDFHDDSGGLGDYSAGFGWSPVKSLVLDFHALLSDPWSVDTWGIQAKYAF